jgi:hypothetical protein
MKSKDPHIIKQMSFNDWFYNHSNNEDNGNYWKNQHKLSCIESYFFRYDNYLKGLKNPHILKSTFGIKSIDDIEKEINYWFDKCVGAYSYIE